MAEKENSKKEASNSKIIVLVSLVLLLCGLGVYLGWLFLVDKTTKIDDKTTSTIECGELRLVNDSVKGILPFTPDLEADIGGEYNPNGEICELFFDGKTYGKYKPVGGKCKFDSLKILVSGKYNISYKVLYTNGEFCEKKATISSGPDIDAISTGGEKESYTLYDTP